MATWVRRVSRCLALCLRNSGQYLHRGGFGQRLVGVSDVRSRRIFFGTLISRQSWPVPFGSWRAVVFSPTFDSADVHVHCWQAIVRTQASSQRTVEGRRLTLSSCRGIGRWACRGGGGPRHICCWPKGRTGGCKDRYWGAWVSHGYSSFEFGGSKTYTLYSLRQKLVCFWLFGVLENPVSAHVRGWLAEQWEGRTVF